jgi:hypothetical protein
VRDDFKFKNEYQSVKGAINHLKEVKRKNKKRSLKRKAFENYITLKREMGGDLTNVNLYEKWLSASLLYIINNSKCDYNIDISEFCVDGRLIIPVDFSIIDYPTKSYAFIKTAVLVLISQNYPTIIFDYKDCKRMDLATQVYLDVIIYHFIQFLKRCDQNGIKTKVKKIQGDNVHDININKALFSVGSPAIHDKGKMFPDIIPYPLCIRSREKKLDAIKIAEKKDIDTTNLADYVIQSLNKVGKTLSPDRLDDLCKVIGEILINAEEHATAKHRYSVGYFIDKKDEDSHYGVFHLVILNFGQTIYEKFNDPDCPNKRIVEKMKQLSEKYTKNNFFFGREFEEETLWTLYALQEGVTSVVSNKKRGNGSIQFIESFFNLRNDCNSSDEISNLVILSGNTKISFDGSYQIENKIIDNEQFKVMTFNKQANIEYPPDKKFVTFTKDYFPGTLISAKILLKEEDLIDHE